MDKKPPHTKKSTRRCTICQKKWFLYAFFVDAGGSLEGVTVAQAYPVVFSKPDRSARNICMAELWRDFF